MIQAAQVLIRNVQRHAVQKRRILFLPALNREFDAAPVGELASRAARRAADLRAERAVPEMHERQTPADDRADGDSTPERFDAAHRKLKRSRDARKPLFLIVAQRLGVEDVEPRAAVQRESPAACERNGVDVVAVHLAQPGLFQRRETRFQRFLVRGPEDRREDADEPFAERFNDLRRNAFHGQEDLIKALPCGDLRKLRKARPQCAGAAAVPLFRCRRRGSVGSRPRLCRAARVQQLGERLAPQRVERARREHVSGRDIGGKVRHGKRRAAGLDKILFGARGIERSVDRLFGRIARDSAGILPVRHGERALCFRQ